MADARRAVLRRGLSDDLERFPAVLALTCLRETPDGDEILVGVRTAHNVTHENVISVPTIRVLADVAERWAATLPPGGLLRRASSLDHRLWDGVRRNVSDLMALKLGMGDALESGKATFDVELLVAGQGTSLIGFADGCDVTEDLSMFNALVRLDWQAGDGRRRIRRTASYDPLVWLPVEEFRAMVRERDPGFVTSAAALPVLGERVVPAPDVFDLCVRGLCIESAICALDDAFPLAADLDEVVAGWVAAGAVSHAAPIAAGTAGVEARNAAVRRATALVDALAQARAQQDPAPVTATDMVVLVKQPHARSTDAVRAVVARLLAFGVEVTDVRRLGAPGRVTAEVLYPDAVAGYERRPAVRSDAWKALVERFACDRFTALVGAAFDPSMVVAGADLVAEELDGDAARLTRIWEQGRVPVDRRTVVEHYGVAAARALLGANARAYAWFRGPEPLGIQRLAPGLTAFALRHPEIRGGAPTIVLNGHVPGLAALVDGAVAVGCRLPERAGLSALAPSPDLVRRWVIGDDNRPWACEPGTVRHDADTRSGVFATEDDGVLATRLDGRVNVVHASDGWLSGAREAARLLGTTAVTGGRLVRRLRAGGLTVDEIDGIVLADPQVERHGTVRPLSSWANGPSLDGCVEQISLLVPPVFGAANGWATGMAYDRFVQHVERLVGEHGGSAEAFSMRHKVRALARPARTIDELARHEQRGVDLIACGAVGVLVPAGGTAGRFAGYVADERTPERSKGVVPLLTSGGRVASLLDVRLANTRHWRRATGGRVRLGVMAAQTNLGAIHLWRWAQPDPDVDVFVQHGVYRLAAGRSRGGRWIDRIARREDGSPRLKPPGNLGVLAGFVLSGLYDAWRAAGVEYLALGNIDDAAWRLDPRVLGSMVDEGVDAVVLAVGAAAPGSVTGGLVCATGDGDDPAVVEGWAVLGDPTAADGPWLGNTNQIYVRCDALDGVLGGGSRLERSQRLTGAVGTYAERRPVTDTRGTTDVIQLVQHHAGVVELLAERRVLLLGVDPPCGRGGHTPIKRPADVARAQARLDRVAFREDELLFLTDCDGPGASGNLLT